MFEEQDFDTIMERMLEKVPDNLDKREGSVIWDALAPAALELSEAYANLSVVLDEGYADTASYYYLVKRAAERGIYPEEATKAVLKGEFSPSSIIIEEGTRFNHGDLNYVVTEHIAAGEYKLECETEGIIGNQQLGVLTPIEYVDGLETAVLTEVLIPGEDEEDEEVFRERYFDSFESRAFGGNVADYKEKTKGINGVGGVKVIPAWDGGGTVKLMIISSEYAVPSDTLIAYVQNEMDPDSTGNGNGIAPIGHVVTVSGVASQTVNISSTITYAGGYSYEALESQIQDAIEAYFLELCESWEVSDSLIVRISQIETRLLSITGIEDIEGTTLNGVAANLTVMDSCIPVRGGCEWIEH